MIASNMQGSTNSGNTTNFNPGNTTSHARSSFYMHGRMGAGGFSSAECMYAQAAVGNFCPHTALHVESEAEHIPHCGNVGGLLENPCGRANQFTDGERRSCKRKSLEGFTAPARHDMGSVSSFSTPVMPASTRYWEEPVIPRLGLMGGASMAPDYMNSALSVSEAIEGLSKEVFREDLIQHTTKSKNLPRLPSSRNYDWHGQLRTSPSEQQNIDPAATNASAVLRNRCQFPTSSVFQRRDLVPDERNENFLTVGSRFSFNARWMGKAIFFACGKLASSSIIPGIPNQRRPMSDPMSANPILNSRGTEPWYPTQNLHTQIPRANFDVAQGYMCSSRSGQGNHLTCPSGAISVTPVDMVINPETGSQGPHHWRSSRMEHHSDWHLRPLMRSILDISFERLQTLQNEDDRHNGIISEDFLLFDPSEFYGVDDIHDRHRDMRLDVDNMTYEELLALGERIGNVSTGLTEESISKCLKIRTYSSSNKSFADEASHTCSICQEAYEDDDELGTLECGHDHHTECINKWLLQKNECPVCKASALNT
ncbi:hypothetical protein KI387_037972 [Taxus chinensis]|uniref:RING-type E3 ubiquitin transferase n=1 Tax=Taxus chinensis TaxID=29808 RepID=A0AA38FSW1_TAXCH|nr:hypothetical protein KI387_037972 [Taxus chinensis]